MIIKPGVKIFDKDKEEFCVLDEIGSGGCGVVYKIKKISSEDIYALKTLSPSFTDEKLLKGLIHDAQAAIGIDHRNVIKYYYFHNGSIFSELPPYIIMEYADGGSLSDSLKSQKEIIAEKELLEFYYPSLLSGMKAINKKIIHRDIKPENILFKNSVLKIADFGLSKILDEKTRISSFKGWGTPKYIAPEAWKGKDNTIQMDIYSMGILFYELLTLSYPYEVTNPYDITALQDAHMFAIPKRIEALRNDVAPKLKQIILKMIEKEVSLRYKNWDEIESDLNNLTPAIEIDHTIADLVQKRMAKDEQLLKEKLEQEKRLKDQKAFESIVQYKIEKDIIDPFRMIIDKFNTNYVKGKITISKRNSPHDALFDYSIHLLSGTMLSLRMRVLHDEDCYRDYVFDDFGTRRSRREFHRPQVQSRNILAWGIFESQNRDGFNIILLENIETMYGDWFVLINRNSAFAGKHARTIEPFAFRFEELFEEIEYIRAMHVYTTKIEPLAMEQFTEYIDKYN